MSQPNEITTQNLVIGTGAAGLMLALKLAESQSVVLITKTTLENNNSRYAQGGIASALAAFDDPDYHVKDTIEAGAGLCHPGIVRNVIRRGPKVIEELVEIGVPFTPYPTPSPGDYPYHLTKEGGHSKRRVIHVRDITGRALTDSLIAKAKAHPNIEILLHHMAVDLITTDKVAPDFSHNRCLGAYILDRETSHIKKIDADNTYLCTGGCGKTYLFTSNPDCATGDGVSIAWRAGCKVANLEFMQFHPTCLFHDKYKNFLLSEALRGEGAILRDFAGEPFMAAYHDKKELAPRDIVARAIDDVLKRSGAPHVYLDCRHIDHNLLKSHFENIYNTLLKGGIDFTQDLVPVVPAAHYSCGGVVVDEHGQTQVANLYALGEVACTGLHGANRLASNSLLEALVYADIVAEKVLSEPVMPAAKRHSIAIPSWQSQDAMSSDELVVLSHTWDEIRRLMWNYVGIVRTNKRLARAMARIELIRKELQTYYWDYKITGNFLELRNLSDMAYLTIRCAQRRKESRGIHYNTDYQRLLPPKDTIVNTV